LGIAAKGTVGWIEEPPPAVRNTLSSSLRRCSACESTVGLLEEPVA
jgi:hypothetical protein